MDVVEAAGLSRSQLIIQSFWPANLDVAKQRMPHVVTSLLTLGATPDNIKLARTRATTTCRRSGRCPTDLIRQAHQLGRLVLPFTIDTSADARAAAKAGVEGVISDDPLMVARALGLRPARTLTAKLTRRPARIEAKGKLRLPPACRAARAAAARDPASAERQAHPAHATSAPAGRLQLQGGGHRPRGARRAAGDDRLRRNAKLLPRVVGRGRSRPSCRWPCRTPLNDRGPRAAAPDARSGEARPRPAAVGRRAGCSWRSCSARRLGEPRSRGPWAATRASRQYQFHLPSSFIVAGSITPRTSVASSSTAVASPTPNCFMSMTGASRRCEHPTITTAAALTTLAVDLMPWLTASGVDSPRSTAS